MNHKIILSRKSIKGGVGPPSLQNVFDCGWCYDCTRDDGALLYIGFIHSIMHILILKEPPYDTIYNCYKNSEFRVFFELHLSNEQFQFLKLKLL